MNPSRRATTTRSAVGLVMAAVVTCSMTLALAVPADALQESRASKWTIGFGSIGPVTTDMTVKQAISTLHSKATSKASTPYCGLFGLTGNLPTGLAGFAPKRNGKLALLSVGFLLGSSRAGLPKTVQTSAGIHIGSTLEKLKAAYPHQLSETTDYYNKVEILRGPKRLGIAFEISGGKVVNIATGPVNTLVVSEYCG